MGTKWYKKEIPDSAVFVAGHPLRFDFLETSDAMLIAELDKCVQRQVGGVIAISQEEYAEEVKKKETYNRLNGNSKPHQRQELSALRLDARRVVEAVANPSPRRGMFARPQVPTDAIRPTAGNQPMPDPIEIPSPESFMVKPPPTMKLNAKP